MDASVKSIGKVKTVKRKTLTNMDSKNLSLLLLALPVLLWVLIFSYLPLSGLVLAFKEYRINLGIFKSPWNGFDNFKFFFVSSDALRITAHTIGYNLVFIAIGLVIPVTIAIMLNEIGMRVALKFYQTTMFFPHFMSWVIVAYMLYAFLNPRLGVVNTLIKSIGGETVYWYGNPFYWYFILPIANTWKHVGFSALFYYAALMGIDKEYYEAAEIDGASKLKQIWHISLPFLSPLMIMLAILAVGRVIRSDFGLFYLLPMSTPSLYTATDVIDTYVFRALVPTGVNNKTLEIGIPAAVGLFQSIVGLILVVLTNKIIRKIQPESSLY